MPDTTGFTSNRQMGTPKRLPILNLGQMNVSIISCILYCLDVTNIGALIRTGNKEMILKRVKKAQIKFRMSFWSSGYPHQQTSTFKICMAFFLEIVGQNEMQFTDWNSQENIFKKKKQFAYHIHIR